MQIYKDYALDRLHTFGLKVKAKQLIKVSAVEEVQAMSRMDLSQVLILGGGSNILFTKDYEGLVIKNNILGKEVVLESDREVLLRIGGGENWNDLVEWTVGNGWGGLENLIAIPGSVGAAPVQNIGAYGVSIGAVTVRVEGVFLESGKREVFEAEACEFDYRSSIFKTSLKGKFFITHLVVRLTPAEFHRVNLDYPALRNYLHERSQTPSIKSVAEAVKTIRESKLPNPEVMGNAGSFFKNPVISGEQLAQIKKDYPEVPSFNEGTDLHKIPAAWLIEKAGWKGVKRGNAATHQHQPLVLVALSSAAKGEEIEALSSAIQQSVKELFKVELTPEVNIL
jgi:UDP-N-acetylmuramate dehydrogenase